MRAELFFLKLQGKKYVKVVPVILLESLLFALLVLGFGSYMSKAVYGKASLGEIKVGIVSEEENSMTNMLIRFVESMDSFQESFQFQKMEQSSAQEALDKGEIYAVVRLPEGILEGILNGTNPSAEIVLGHAYSQMEAEVFREIAMAGSRLLSVAQAGIYAAEEACVKTGHEELIGDTQEQLNRAYLDYALERSSVFKMHEITATGKTGLVAYYSVALFLVFLSFVGMIMGRCATVKATALSDMLTASEIGYTKQYLLETLAFSGVFTLFGAALGIPVLIFAMHVENQGLPHVAGIFLLLGILFTLGAFIRCLIELTGKEAGGLGIGLAVLFLMMLSSGLILPSAFLPEILEKIGRFLPYQIYLETILTIVQKKSTFDIAGVLLLILVGSMLMGGFLFRLRKVLEGKGKKEDTFVGFSFRTGLMGILSKQYLIKHRVWFLVLFCAALILLLMGRDEKVEEIRGFQVGVYAEDEDGEALLKRLNTEENMFHFIRYDDEEQMMRQVENSTLECAFVLPENFYKNLEKGKTNRQIHLYYAPGSATYKLSYEVMFSHLFAMLSENILQEWLVESGLSEEVSFAELVSLKEKYETNGSTFSFQYEDIDKENESVNAEGSIDAVIDPLRGCIAVIVFFMSLLGLGNCCDVWGNVSRFPRYMAGKIYGYSMHIAVLGAVLSGGVLLLVSGCFQVGHAGKEILGLCFYVVVLEVYLRILRKILKTSNRVYGMIPILLLGSLLFGPVFIQIKTYVPVFAFVENLFPTTWYLRFFYNL